MSTASKKMLLLVFHCYIYFVSWKYGIVYEQIKDFRYFTQSAYQLMHSLNFILKLF